MFFHVHGNCIPRKYFKIWNTLQGPSYPDLFSPVALAELAPLTESQNGAQDVVADKNEGDEEGKIEVVIINYHFFFSLRVFINIQVYVHDWVLFISDSIKEGEEKGWTTKKNSKISGIEIDNEHNNL